jgi:carbamoyl-phosphate synthase large subunit
MLNILFTNIGRRTYLIEFANELKKSGYELNIFVADCSIDTAGFWVDNSVKKLITPRLDDSELDYLSVVFKHCQENDIQVLIPLMDFEFPVLAKNREMFENIGCKIIVSDYELIRQTLDKKLNHEFCLNNKILVPESFYTYDSIPENVKIIRKKIEGSGSVGVSIHPSKESLVDFCEKTEMVQTFIEGDEYGMDILNDFNGKFIHSCCKKKIAMRFGETDKAEVVYNDKLVSLARKISSIFSHIGNMDLDFIINDKGEIIIIDINVRFGGGYLFTHYAGFNYLKSIIDMSQGKVINMPIKGKKIIGMKGMGFYFRDLD